MRQMMNKTSVNMILGYPASSKSTLAKQLSKDKSVILNRDTEGGTINDLLPKLETLLINKNNIILDNLFPTLESRKPFIELCKKYHADIECHVMNTSIEDSTFNAVQRAIGILGTFPTPEAIKKAKHPNIFPPAVLFKYRKDYQKPIMEEGFSNIVVHEFVRKTDPSFTNKALILDYDSTIRECINGNGKYPLREEEIKILPNRKEIIQKYKDQGYLLLGLSNQSGVHKKELSAEKASELFQHTNKLLGIEIDYHFCPHQSAPISCYCRKPQPGKFVEFMLKYKLDRKQCLFVGDYGTDKGFALRSGIEYIDEAEFFK